MGTIQPIIDAVERFSRDAARDNERVIAWPTIDPTFRIVTIEEEGKFILLYGIDDRDRDAMLIIPTEQFGIQMVAERGDTQRGSFGFTPSMKAKT